MSNSEPSSNSEQQHQQQHYRRHDHRHQQDDANNNNNRPYHHQQRGYYNNFHQQQNNNSLGADPNNQYTHHRSHHHQGQRQENDQTTNGMPPQLINFPQHQHHHHQQQMNQGVFQHHHHHHHHNHHQHFQAHGNFPRFHSNNAGDSNNNERRPYQHHYNNDNNNQGQGYRHHHQQQQGSYNNQPRDYQSVQTHMEVISPGFSATIDIAHLLSNQNSNSEEDSLVAQIFKLNPQVKPAASASAGGNTNEAPAAAVATTTTPTTTSNQAKPNLILALDFHGVVDVVADATEEITPQHIAPICVVSYVGPFGPIRERTRQSLQQRVAAKQISMGIMVFKKLRDPTEKNIPDIEFVASKRHAVELLLKYNKNLTQSGRIVFVDDSKDNVATVQTSQEANGNGKNDGGRIKCSLFSGKTGDELRQFLKNETA